MGFHGRCCSKQPFGISQCRLIKLLRSFGEIREQILDRTRCNDHDDHNLDLLISAVKLTTARRNRSGNCRQQIRLFCFSLGLSWVAGRFAPTQHASAAMLDYLRASIMGLGNSKCEVVFPRCSIREVVKNRGERRKRRRRKRHGDPGEM